jgi:hypothetical protein
VCEQEVVEGGFYLLENGGSDWLGATLHAGSCGG